LALGVVLGAAVLIGGAGASTEQVAIPGSASSKTVITKYLVSVGVDPSGFVVQRGDHNYAGPNCPGRSWTCTAARRVLQIAGRRSDNRFECTASTAPGGSSSPPSDCTIVQVAAGGNNRAGCAERSGDASVSQSCVIFQTNTTGDNRLEVLQQVDARGGATQDATQYGGVDQVNGSGSNDVQIHQDLAQSTRDTDATGLQSQNGHQGVSVNQESETGDNTAHVHQSLALTANATGATVSQNQNTDPNHGLNTSAGITQDSTSGQNRAHLNQSNDLDGTVSKTSNGTQTQGFQDGGFLGHFDQTSSGVSTARLNQREHQDLKIDGGDNRDDHGKKTSPARGVVTQKQYGPMWGGSPQGSNPNDVYDVNQSSEQLASNAASQDDRAYINCDTTGNCTADQRISQNGNTQRNSCSSPSCHIGLIVTTNSDGTSTSTCTGVQNPDGGSEGTCPFPPPPPPPPNRGCIDCITVGPPTGQLP